jgi:hypothetical protein
MSRSLLTQGSRHLPPWLILDVRQKYMNKLIIIVWVLIAANRLFATTDIPPNLLGKWKCDTETSVQSMERYALIDEATRKAFIDVLKVSRIVIKPDELLSYSEGSAQASEVCVKYKLTVESNGIYALTYRHANGHDEKIYFDPEKKTIYMVLKSEKGEYTETYKKEDGA